MNIKERNTVSYFRHVCKVNGKMLTFCTHWFKKTSEQGVFASEASLYVLIGMIQINLDKNQLDSFIYFINFLHF